MRTTITVNDTLFEEASLCAGEENASKLITTALELLVSLESRKRLLILSGKAPNFSIPERGSRSDHSMVAEDETRYE